MALPERWVKPTIKKKPATLRSGITAGAGLGGQVAVAPPPAPSGGGFLPDLDALRREAQARIAAQMAAQQERARQAAAAAAEAARLRATADRIARQSKARAAAQTKPWDIVGATARAAVETTRRLGRTVPQLPRMEKNPYSGLIPRNEPPPSIAKPYTPDGDIEQRKADAAQRAEVAAFVERYNIGTGKDLDRGYNRGANNQGFISDDIDRIRDIARREGISVKEATRRVRQAQYLAPRLKQQYRELGLYFGDMSPGADPLLMRAAAVEQAQFISQEALEEAVTAYEGQATKLTDRAQMFARQNAVAAAERIRRAAIPGVSQSDEVSEFIRRFAKANGAFGKDLDTPEAEAVRRLLRMANNDELVRGNPQGFLQAYQVVQGMAREDANRDSSVKAQIGRALGSAVSDVASAASYLQEQLFMQPYYAGQFARNEGEGAWGETKTVLSALPGLGFLGNDKKTKGYRSATDTWDERQALTERGKLQSFGQVMSDALLSELRGVRIAGTSYQPFKKADVSGAIDLGFTLVADPLNAIGAGATRLGRVGEYSAEAGARAAAREAGVGIIRRNLTDLGGLVKAVGGDAVKGLDPVTAAVVREQVQRNVILRATAARMNYLDNTATGRAILQAAEDVAGKGFDSAAVQRAVPGLSQETAMAVASASSKKEAVDALRSAFVTGEWNPNITLRRQGLAALRGGKALSAPSAVGLGSRVARTDQGLFNVLGRARKVVRGNEVRSVTTSSTVRALHFNTLRAGLARAGQRFEDVYTSIAGAKVGLDVEDRLSLVWEEIEGKAELEALFDDGLRAAEKDAMAALGIDPKKATLADIARVAASDEFEGWLKQMEVVSHLSTGALGKDAAQQVLAEAKFTMPRKFQEDRWVLNRALKNAGLGNMPDIGAAAKKNAEGVRFLQSKVFTAHRQGLLSDDARDALLREVDRTAGLKSNKMRAMEQRIEALVQSPEAAREFDRLLKGRSELVGAWEGGLSPVGLGRRLVNMPVKLLNSVLEPVAPSKVSFLGYGNDAYAIRARVEGVDRWAADLGLDDFSRVMLRQSAEHITTEDQLFRLVHDTMYMVGKRAGMDEDSLGGLRALVEEDLLDIKTGRKKMTHAFFEDGVVKTTDEVQTLAQRGEVVYLPDPEDVKRTIREWKAAQEGLFTHPLQKGRVGLAKVLDANILGAVGPVAGNPLSARYIFQQIHRKWKYLTVVPGLELATLGATVGFLGTEGSLEDRLKNAAQGASIGLLSPLRYIVRVGGIEEGLRKYLSEGFNVEMFKPHFSRYATQQGLDRPFTLHNAVKAGDPIGLQSHRLLETAHREWDALLPPGKNPVARLGRKQTRYLDAYGRVLDYQIHPETDAVADIVLRRNAGEITDAEAVQMFADFMSSDAGSLWLKRLKGAYGGPKSADEAWARYNDFINHHASDPAVARARLDTAREFAKTGKKVDVDRSVLKDAAKRNATPEVVHAEKTFTIPKTFKEIALFRSQFTSRFAFEGPTTALNRVPMAKAVYRDEYQRLLANGVDPKRAQSLAEQVAVDRTNRVMFRIDDESRFAAKSDYVFPFQQPREELLRVWAPLIARNPARALHVTNVIARAFNNGQDKGLFYEDRYGNWRMAVPGSAWLSQKLFGFPQGFDFALTDLVFFGQGAYGVNIIPSPGGPYWTAATRLFLNRNREWYEGLSDFEKEWLFPYGSTGRLFRPEVSRVWQAWLGEPAPFEFASQQEQRDALERHRIEVFLQLKYQHAMKTAKVKGDWTTGDLNWEPDAEQLDKAVSASLKAWAFIGATFPAGPQKVRPDQKAFDALRSQYTLPDGAFDYFRFVDENPGMEPWLTGMTERDTGRTFDEWAKEYERTDKMLRYTSTKSFTEWRSEMKERQREAQAYAERNEIALYGDSTMRSALYDEWDRKYPELAQGRVDNYERDMDLMFIEGTLIGQPKEEALNSWRKRYNVTYGTYKALAARLRQGDLRSNFDPWATARNTDTIVADIERQLRSQEYGVGNATGNFDLRYNAEQRLVSRLPVAEQIKYWQHRVNTMDYDWTDDPDLVLDRYYAVKGNLSALWKSAPMTLDRAVDAKPKTAWKKAIEEKHQDYRESISGAYAEAKRLDAEMDKLASKKQWKEYYALKERRNALYDAATAMKNEWYEGDFNVEGFLDDIKAVMVFAARGDKKALDRISKFRQEHGYFVPSDEQSAYLNMNSDIKSAYVDRLVNGLSIESLPGEFKEGKLFWEWLTDFQRDLLENNLPAHMVDDWKAQSPSDSSGKRKKYGYYGGRGYGRRYRGGGSIAMDELSYAYAMFKKYNKRAGAKAPAAYKEYLELPNDAALRSAFLRKHPEVAAYIKLGPMANMPPALAMIVADIMIRNGKWEGEARSMSEITEIGFAREMMERWNMRGDRQAPAALEAWTNMPSGPEKVAYLKAHPEIQEWLQLGPMANMPEMYREVVRDIMLRYGMWTDNQDPLGKTIQGYFSTPSYARDQYLEDHPELVEYWKATRSKEQQAQYALADQYFSIKDPNTKRAFLQMHPELQEFFLNQRQKRYERFLNQVAIYTGSNPELFEKYLERQEDVLSDLLHKFSDAPLMRERYFVRGAPATGRAATRAAA